MKTTVTVKIETHTDGKQVNIECFTISAEAFINNTDEFQINLAQCARRTFKELTNPTPKTPMA